MHPALIDLENNFMPSRLVRIDDHRLKTHKIELWIKRDDLLHPVISGNKWRKLKYCLNHALLLGDHTIVSMGGQYSNHLHALAYAARSLNIKTVGLVRGAQTEPLTPTLKDCRNWGMELRFVTRSDYRLLRQYREPHEIPDLEPGQYWLPEGGAQKLALSGVAELVDEIDVPFDTLCMPCGTGATLAGCIDALKGTRNIIGFAALKNASYMTADVTSLLAEPYPNWCINRHYHFGGFAKTTPELLEFIRLFESMHHIPLEPVYSGKMLYGLYDMIAKGYFRTGQRLIALHTGGLQGKRGFFTT